MKHLHIALLQLAPTGSLEGNLEKGLAACGKAKALGADIALFPEMWSIGYNIYGRPAAEWTAEAIPAGGPFTEAFRKRAAELDLAIGVTLLETCEGGPRNTLCLFDCSGEEVLRYAKVHTCDFDAERHLTPGNGFVVSDLSTAAGPVRVGAMICYDREFPESARALMLLGAELALAPNACPMELNRLSQLRARAFENMMAVATCNYPAGVPDCNGRSTVFDGIAWADSGERDMCILEAPGGEGLYLAALDLAALRDYREREAFGDAYRRPEMYRELVKDAVRYPFVREDARR